MISTEDPHRIPIVTRLELTAKPLVRTGGRGCAAEAGDGYRVHPRERVAAAGTRRDRAPHLLPRRLCDHHRAPGSQETQRPAVVSLIVTKGDLAAHPR